MTKPNGESVGFLLLAGDFVRSLARFCRVGAFTFRFVFIIISMISTYSVRNYRRNRRFRCRVLPCSRTLAPWIALGR
jgi:hypothetical protein